MRPEKTITHFVAELCKLAQDCNYSESVQQMLRDRLVYGVNDEHIQRRLLAKQNLTILTALKLALLLETADKMHRTCNITMQLQRVKLSWDQIKQTVLQIQTEDDLLQRVIKMGF